MRSVYVSVASALIVFSAPFAAAQDTPPPSPAAAEPDPAEVPPPVEDPVERERRLAERDREIRVVREDEMRRIRLELERLRQERRRLSAEESTLSSELRDLAADALDPELEARREVLALSLEQAVAQALENNPDFLVSLEAARATQEGVPIAEAGFDPTLTASVTRAESRDPFFSFNPFSGFPVGLNVNNTTSWSTSVAVSKRFQLGTTASLTYTDGRVRTDNVFALNPAYSPSLQLQVVQPLLRNFGFDANGAPIRIAEFDALVGDANYVESLLAGVLAVEESYWGLVRAEEELRFQDRSLQSTLKFLEDQERRLAVGAASELDVILAQTAVSAARESTVRAENALETARDNLLRLIRAPRDADKWNLLPIPTDRPWLLPLEIPSLQEALQVAYARQPSLYRAQLTLERQRQNLLFQENQALPAVDLVGTFTEQGLGSSHHSAWSNLGSGDFYGWSLGVQLELPLFLRAERARVRQAEAQLRQAEAQIHVTEADLSLNVRRNLRDIRTARTLVESTRDSRALTARQLQATRIQVENGTAVPRDVLEDLSALAQAESREVQAFIDFRLAISRLQSAQGTLLDPFLDRLPERVRASLQQQR